MKNILFVTEDYGPRARFATDLVKVLWPHYSCDVLWRRSKIKDFSAFVDKYDLIFAAPDHCMQLKASYGAPYDKMIALAQADTDIFPSMRYMQDQLRGFAVTAPLLQHIAFACGITRPPPVLPIGIYCANYAIPAGDTLQRLIWLDTEPVYDYSSPNNVDVSRKNLGYAIAEAAGLPLTVAPENFHFLVTEALYNPGDLGIFCSLTGTPYATLEAFAAGIPVLGTETGIFSDLAQSGGGGPLPFDEKELVTNAVEVIRALRENPELYRRMSAAALAESQKHDWSVLKQTWLEFLQGA